MSKERKFLDTPKNCSKCGSFTTDFTDAQSHCRPCCAIRTALWRIRNPDKLQEIYRRDREENKVNVLKRMHSWRERNPRRMLYLHARQRAKQQNVEFTITEADIEIPEVCPVFGMKIYMNKTRQNGRAADDSMSLDRLDPTKGYVPENIWVISWKANWLKGKGTLEELEILTKKLREKIYGTNE